jgi:hypothetical protein
MGNTLPPWGQCVDTEVRRRCADDLSKREPSRIPGSAGVGQPTSRSSEAAGIDTGLFGGWQTFKPNKKALEKAWRVLYSIPESMTQLLTGPQEQWEQVLLRWLRHKDERG